MAATGAGQSFVLSEARPVGAIAAAKGSGFTCALMSGGKVKCWGPDGPQEAAWDAAFESSSECNRYLFLQAGAPCPTDTPPPPPVPTDIQWKPKVVPLGTGRTAVQVAVVADHACVVLDNGRVKVRDQVPVHAAHFSSAAASLSAGISLLSLRSISVWTRACAPRPQRRPCC